GRPAGAPGRPGPPGEAGGEPRPVRGDHGGDGDDRAALPDRAPRRALLRDEPRAERRRAGGGTGRLARPRHPRPPAGDGPARALSRGALQLGPRRVRGDGDPSARHPRRRRRRRAHEPDLRRRRADLRPRVLGVAPARADARGGGPEAHLRAGERLGPRRAGARPARRVRRSERRGPRSPRPGSGRGAARPPGRRRQPEPGRRRLRGDRREWPRDRTRRRRDGRAPRPRAGGHGGLAVRETREAFRAFLDLVRDSDAVFLEGPRAVRDEVSVLEGYRWLTEILSVALECYLWADADRPSFVEIVGPTRKFGGDNADAYYSFAPLDPRRTYRVTGRNGDACYLSLC